MKQLLIVFVGGGLGSALRFMLAKFLNVPDGFPYGTFIVNILGSLFLGVILGYALKNNSISSGSTLLLATGFCGGFTTFSTFMYENQNFLKSGEFFLFAGYTIGSFALGLLAVFLGLWLVKFI
ncbi:MAG TPA: fluoride efflux transporter CrcB [Flavobacteriaceae bacterium]|nr:fluoride efflux transporter CrcB [Flavobacteriaceae bacterium]